MEQRIKTIRKEKHMTQTEFGARIGVKGNTVTGYETGLRTPSDAVIRSICREFGVSERWLRTGEGEMYTAHSASSGIAAFVGDVLGGEPDFRQRFLGMLADLTDDEWRLLEKMTAALTEKTKNTGP